MGANINGPSLIQVPAWIERRLGKYYLYFAAHDGAYIRLAYADALAGPWRAYEPGTLHLAQTGFPRHVASPDVHVDDADRRIRMYFHGCCADGVPNQVTCVATSGDGLHFVPRPEHLGASYWRAFERDGWTVHARNAGPIPPLARSPDRVRARAAALHPGDAP